MRIEARPTLILNTRDPEKDAIDLYWLVGLLKDIRGGSSLVLASKNSGVSYRGVWGKLNQVEASLGIPLVVRTKGHGSKLTEFGSFLCQFIEELQGAYRSEEHTSELQSRVDISYAVFCFKKTATTEIYTLSLHDALPISPKGTAQN